MNKSEVDKHFFRIPFYYFFLNECYFIDNVTFSYLWASLKYQFSTDIKKNKIKKKKQLQLIKKKRLHRLGYNTYLTK